MRVLLDTNILLWAIYNSDVLSSEALEILHNNENDFAYSIASLWEIEIKHNKSPNAMPMSASEVYETCCAYGLKIVGVKPQHVFSLGDLKLSKNAPNHKDLFDRLLLCQSVKEERTLLTHDRNLLFYNLGNVELV